MAHPHVFYIIYPIPNCSNSWFYFIVKKVLKEVVREEIMSNQRKKSLERKENIEQVNNIKKNKEDIYSVFLNFSFPLWTILLPKAYRLQ